MALPLLERYAPAKRFLADQAYDSNAIRDWLAEHRITPVIPNHPRRTIQHPFDKRAYRKRNAIERLFCRIKDWRRIATRFDKTARNYLASIALVAAVTCFKA